MVDIERMRVAFVLAAAWEGWSASDQAEYGAAIRAALEANDEPALAWWEQCLEQASGLAYMADLCRAAEARIKAAAEARRKSA